MFSCEWEIKSTTKLAAKEAAKYREQTLDLAFPWRAASAAEAGGDTNIELQSYAMDVIMSLCERCATHMLNTVPQLKSIPNNNKNNDDVLPSSVSERGRELAQLWAPIVFKMVATDLPEVTIGATTGRGGAVVEKSVLRSVEKSQHKRLVEFSGDQIAAFQVNQTFLSFMSDDQYHVERPHQLSLFFYLRVRYLLEKLLVRTTPKLLQSAVSVLGAEATVALQKNERRLRKYIHHCLFTNLILSRPCVGPSALRGASLLFPSTAQAVMMTTNTLSTEYVLEGRTLMGPGVGIVRIATAVSGGHEQKNGNDLRAADAAHTNILTNKGINLVIVAPDHAFPFAIGSMGDDLYSATLNALRQRKEQVADKDHSELYYFGEERLRFEYPTSNTTSTTSTNSFNGRRLNFALHADDISNCAEDGLRGHAFCPLHVAFDSLWELFWPSYASAASRVDGVSGDWLVPDALQAPRILEAEEVLFELTDSDDRVGIEEEDVDDTMRRYAAEPDTCPTLPATMDDCLLFALAESLKELQLKERAQQQASPPPAAAAANQGGGKGQQGKKKGRDKTPTASANIVDPNAPIKVSMISMMGLYLKRHSPRIPLFLRSAALGGKSDSVTLPSSLSGAAAHKSDNEGEEDDDDDEGKSKMSKAEKMAKRKAEKEAKLLEKKGGGKKGSKVGKGTAAEDDAPSTTTPTDDANAEALKLLLNSATMYTDCAITLDAKHSSYKKVTTFFKEVAARSNGAYFTVPNDNEILVKTQKQKLKQQADVYDFMRDAKRRFGPFAAKIHTTLIAVEEQRKTEEAFANVEMVNGVGGAGGSESLDDEAKATVTSIAQFYGFNNSVSAKLAEVFLGRWQPKGKSNNNNNNSNNNNDDTEDSDGNEDTDDENQQDTVAKIIMDVATMSSGGSSSASVSCPQPEPLHALIGAKGKPVYNKSSILKNLRFYIIKNGLFYADDAPIVVTTNESVESNTNNNLLPSITDDHSPAEEATMPVWQRALLRREAERKAMEAEAEELRKAAAAVVATARPSQPSSSSAAKGPMMVHLDELLTKCMRVAASDTVMDIATFFNNVTWRLLMPQTRIVSQSPHRAKTLWIKSSLPTVTIKTKKRPGNRTVVYVVGVGDYGLSLPALAHRWRKEMACSVAVEVSPPMLGQGACMCLALTGKVAANVQQSLVQLGIPSTSIVSS